MEVVFPTPPYTHVPGLPCFPFHSPPVCLQPPLLLSLEVEV